jgi:hypothetical protein
MHRRDRTHNRRNKKQIKAKTVYLALFVAAMFVFSSAVTAIDTSSEPKNMNDLKEENTPIYPVDGLAPEAIASLNSGAVPAAKGQEKGMTGSGGNQNPVPLPFQDEMYGYCAANCPGCEGPVKFPIDDPGTIESLSCETLTNFASGAVWTCDERWIVCEYSNGALYEIDPEDGAITSIGGGGNALNGMALDPTDQTVYGIGASGLYKLNVEDGSQEFIGATGVGDTMIGISCTSDGSMYAWDVKFSGDTYLYEVNKETGECTQLFSFGKTLCFAQDGDFWRADDILWLTAYIYNPEYGGYLCKVDIEAETFEIVDQFQSSAEIDGSMFIQGCIPPEHDLGLKSIDLPADGYATDEMDVEVTVKNYGNNSEVTDVQFEIIKCEEGPPLDVQNFTGTFPPAGWTTDYWRQSNSNYAGGTAPEARVNKYWVGYGYDNYIRSKPENATGFEKVNVKFRMYLDAYYPQYTYFYLKYRKNDTSPWRDASPWGNPIGDDLGPKNYEIGCYGWGEELGDAFEVQWGIQGTYYYYWNDVYLDDFELYGCAGCAEYADLAEDVEVPFESEVSVSFEKWTPSEWHNEEFVDTWEEYPLAAYTTLKDNNSRNDKKQKLLNLYYPFLHDVGTMELNGPQDGPAQVFPFQGVIKNIGQYDECCFKTYAEVAEIDYTSTTNVFDYDFGTSCYPFPRDGWSRSDTNWQCSYSSYFGSYSPCLRFYYWPISYPKTYRFVSPMMDTTDLGAVKIQFDQYQSYNYGTYTMEVETSNDGSTWDTVYSNTGPIGPETTVIETGENVGGDFYIAFSVKTVTYSILYWYIDNIEIDGFPLYAAEYNDEYCVSDLEVGQELVIDFNDWTPDFLQYETTGTKTYKARVWTDMQSPPDQQRVNDEVNMFLTLDYFHDVGIQGMQSPADDDERIFFAVDSSARQFNWFTYDDPGTFNYISNFPGSAFPQGATFDKDQKMWVCDTYGNIWYKEDPYDTAVVDVGSTGTGECTGLAFCEKNGVMYGSSTSQLYEIDMNTGDATVIGSFGGGSNLMISLDCDRDGNMYAYDLNFANSKLFSIDLDTGAATEIGNTGVSMNFGQDMAYDWAEEEMLATIFNYGTYWAELRSVDLTTGAFTYIDDCEPQQVTVFAIPGGGVPLETYLAPGTYDIDAIAENIGTFPEEDMSCTADIYEYITECENGTWVYGDLIENIDILEPLGGEEVLEFADYTFADEGFYAIFLNLTDDDDDDLGNNVFAYGIGCDDTPPSSAHSLDPPNPDGLNGWYVSDLEVTLNAADPSIGCEIKGSGVDYMVYEVDGDQGTITGDSGTFTITQEDDGDDVLVEYWAVDNVGNEETPHHTFTIDMDQTPPEIDLTYEWSGTKPPWEFTFTANATDATSGMDYVEFYFNALLQKTEEGPGPIYTYTLLYMPIQNAEFTAIGYDIAGLFAEDVVKDPETNAKSVNAKTSSTQQTIRIPMGK